MGVARTRPEPAEVWLDLDDCSWRSEPLFEDEVGVHERVLDVIVSMLPG